jgi:hypothetical protein
VAAEPFNLMNQDDNLNRQMDTGTMLITHDLLCKFPQVVVEVAIIIVGTMATVKDQMLQGWREVIHHTHLLPTTAHITINEVTTSIHRGDLRLAMKTLGHLDIGVSIHLSHRHLTRLRLTVDIHRSREGILLHGGLSPHLTPLLTEASIHHPCHLSTMLDLHLTVMKAGTPLSIMLTTVPSAEPFPHLLTGA